MINRREENQSVLDLDSLGFERTVWAERKLAKLCPGNNIKRFNEVLATEDTDAQFEAMETMILIMHEAYERKQKFLNTNYESKELTKDMLELLSETELADLTVRAFDSFKKDGEQTVEVEVIKNTNTEVVESISQTAGSSTSDTCLE